MKCPLIETAGSSETVVPTVMLREGSSQKTVMLIQRGIWYRFGSWLMDRIPCNMSHDDDGGADNNNNNNNCKIVLVQP